MTVNLTQLKVVPVIPRAFEERLHVPRDEGLTFFRCPRVLSCLWVELIS